MSQTKLGVYDFGRQLIVTQDLDPVYVVLWKAQLPNDVLCKWLVAYWCFYHVGTASWITDQKDYWKALTRAASSKEWPRGTERRHFRRAQGIKATEELAALRLTCAELVRGIGHRGEAPRLLEVMQRVKRLRGFGDWIAFKVADMLERLDLCPVRFFPSDIFHMFDSPREGAKAMTERHGPCKYSPYLWAYNNLRSHLGDLTAPPRHERTINIQEIETVLCKWKSHLNNHYEIGKDIKEIHEGLNRFGTYKTSQRLLKSGKQGGLW